MDEFWSGVRLFNMGVLFLSFMIGVYKAVLRNVTHRGAFNWDRFMNMCWTVLSLYSIGEILYLTVEGGPRVVVSSLVMVLQLYVVVFKYKESPTATPRFEDNPYYE